MGNLAIVAQSLGKQYRIGAKKEQYYTLREMIMTMATNPFKRFGSLRVTEETREGLFWALQDVSFEIKQGEVTGIIGRNGAGKSTLLKILSRITEPTTGKARIRGRLGSLLEVGTGFHPELTGRENIYLNGAVLGMRKAEIRNKFDEIVDFAGVETFLDTPVKRYSSGMFVRLAFSVAAHLEPEILVVDEVLAVGDAAFQKKCIGKMGDVAQQGRTIILVSHDMTAIQRLCSSAFLLDQGRIVEEGPPDEVVRKYMEGLQEGSRGVQDVSQLPRSPGHITAIKEAWIEDAAGRIVHDVFMGGAVRFCYRFRSPREIANPGFGFTIIGTHGQRIFGLNNYIAGNATARTVSEGIAVCEVNELPLLPGNYSVRLALVEDDKNWIDLVDPAMSLTVLPSDVFGSGRIVPNATGVIYVRGAVHLRTNSNAPSNGLQLGT